MAPKKKSPKIQGTTGTPNPYSQRVYKRNAKDPGEVQNVWNPSAPRTGRPAGGYKKGLTTTQTVRQVPGTDRGIEKRVADTPVAKATSLYKSQQKKYRADKALMSKPMMSKPKSPKKK